jgi:capsid protein
MRYQTADERLARLRLIGTSLRRRLGVTAASVAVTEDRIADTLDRIARVRPRDAERLRARAAHARSFAAEERDRAARYCRPADAPDNGPEASSP